MSESQGRVFPLLRRGLGNRPLTARRAAGLISIVTLILTIGGGVLVWMVDRDGFPDIGLALWWAVQTLTTVGYGDEVPGTTAGRVIGTIVMLNGIAFLTVITAAVTALLVEQMRRRRGFAKADAEEDESFMEPAVAAALADISARLTAIEASLTRGREGP